jgi:hypothetical protein
VDLRTTACTTADRTNPRINAHKISQVMDPASANACPIALTTAPRVGAGSSCPKPRLGQ